MISKFPELDKEVKELRNKVLDYHNHIDYHLEVFISLTLSNDFNYFMRIRSFLEEANLSFKVKTDFLRKIFNGKILGLNDFDVSIREKAKDKDLIVTFKDNFFFSKNDFFSRLDRLNKLRNKLAHNLLHFNRMSKELREENSAYIKFMKEKGIKNPKKTLEQLEEDYQFLLKIFHHFHDASLLHKKGEII